MQEGDRGVRLDGKPSVRRSDRPRASNPPVLIDHPLLVALAADVLDDRIGKSKVDRPGSHRDVPGVGPQQRVSRGLSLNVEAGDDCPAFGDGLFDDVFVARPCLVADADQQDRLATLLVKPTDYSGCLPVTVCDAETQGPPA